MKRHGGMQETSRIKAGSNHHMYTRDSSQIHANAYYYQVANFMMTSFSDKFLKLTLFRSKNLTRDP